MPLEKIRLTRRGGSIPNKTTDPSGTLIIGKWNFTYIYIYYIIALMSTTVYNSGRLIKLSRCGWRHRIVSSYYIMSGVPIIGWGHVLFCFARRCSISLLLLCYNIKLIMRHSVYALTITNTRCSSVMFSLGTWSDLWTASPRERAIWTTHGV